MCAPYRGKDCNTVVFCCFPSTRFKILLASLKKYLGRPVQEIAVHRDGAGADILLTNETQDL